MSAVDRLRVKLASIEVPVVGHERVGDTGHIQHVDAHMRTVEVSLLDRLKSKLNFNDDKGPIEAHVRRITDAIGIDPYDVDLPKLRDGQLAGMSALADGRDVLADRRPHR